MIKRYCSLYQRVMNKNEYHHVRDQHYLVTVYIFQISLFVNNKKTQLTCNIFLKNLKRPKEIFDKTITMFLDSHKVFCRFFTNVRMIIATRIVVPLSLCRVKGSTVLTLLYTAIWLALFPVRIRRFQATWWINVLTLIYQISKANP